MALAEPGAPDGGTGFRGRLTIWSGVGGSRAGLCPPVRGPGRRHSLPWESGPRPH